MDNALASSHVRPSHRCRVLSAWAGKASRALQEVDEGAQWIGPFRHRTRAFTRFKLGLFRTRCCRAKVKWPFKRAVTYYKQNLDVLRIVVEKSVDRSSSSNKSHGLLPLATFRNTSLSPLSGTKVAQEARRKNELVHTPLDQLRPKFAGALGLHVRHEPGCRTRRAMCSKQGSEGLMSKASSRTSFKSLPAT